MFFYCRNINLYKSLGRFRPSYGFISCFCRRHADLMDWLTYTLRLTFDKPLRFAVSIVFRYIGVYLLGFGWKVIFINIDGINPFGYHFGTTFFLFFDSLLFVFVPEMSILLLDVTSFDFLWLVSYIRIFLLFYSIELSLKVFLNIQIEVWVKL